MLTDQQGFKLIDLGIDRNILVYDGQSPHGVLTKALMFNIYRNCPTVTNLLISRDVFVEFVPVDWPPFTNIKCFGIEISYDNRLETGCDNVPSGIWFTYYNNRGCSLAYKSKFLILGYTQKDQPLHTLVKEDVILGSC